MTSNVGWNGLTIPAASLGSTAAVPAPADPALVQRFNEAMAPQSAQASAPAPASEDLSGLPQATDSQLARLSRPQLERLQAKHGDNEAQWRAEAKVLLDLTEKPIQQAILKEIKKYLRKDED